MPTVAQVGFPGRVSLAESTASGDAADKVLHAFGPLQLLK
jgi:hypothetical protein